MKTYVFVFGFFFGVTAFAASNSPSFTYQGRLFNEAGTAPLTGNVTLTLGIYDPNGNCLLYQEEQTVDLTGTSGAFSVQVGQAATSGGKRTANDPQNSMAAVFANGSAISAHVDAVNCPSGSYSSVAGAGRKLRVTVTPQSGSAVTLSPDQLIGGVPQASVAETIQGLTPTQILQITGNATPYTVSKSSLDILLGNVAGGASSAAADATSLHNHDASYVRLGSGGNVALSSGAFLGLGSHASDPAGLTGADAGKTWYDSATGAIKFYDGSQIRTLGVAGTGVQSVSAGTGISISGTTNPTIALDAGTQSTLAAVSGKLSSSLPMAEIFVGNAGGAAVPVAVSGDVSLAASGAMTVGQVGGVSAANVASGANLANAATDAATNGAIVKRNGSGGFSAGSISAADVILADSKFLKLSKHASSPSTTGWGAAETGRSWIEGGVIKYWDGAAVQTLGLSGGGVTGSGSSGYLAKFSGASSVASSAIYESGGNVGVGTITPNAKLSFGSLIQDNSIYLYEDASNFYGFGVRPGQKIDYAAANASLTYGHMSSASVYTERMRIDTAGNVGIGTSSPTAQLDIYKNAGGTFSLRSGVGDSILTVKSNLSNAFLVLDGGGGGGADPVLNFSLNGTNQGSIFYDSNFNRFSIGTVTNNPVVIKTGDLERMRIDNAGNVGIGTTQPGAKLEIAGQVKITGGTPGAGKVLTSDAAGLASWQTPASSGTVTSVGLSLPSEFSVGSAVTTSGNLSGSWASQTANKILASPDGASGTPSFRALASGDIPNLAASKITSGQLAVGQGGTGLSGGTSGGIPYYSAASTMGSSSTLSQFGVVYGGGLGGAPSSTSAGLSGQVLVANTSAAPSFRALADADMPSSISASKISGNISGSAANVTGTVAIGNGGTGATTATAAFNALAPAQAGNGGKFLTTNGSGTVSWATPTADNLGNHTATQNLILGINRIVGMTDGGISIDTLGQVSINSGTMDAWLNVKGGGSNGGNIQMESRTGYKWQITSGNETDGPTNGFIIRDHTVGATRISVDASGNVGIGTTQPVGKLEVTGGSIVGSANSAGALTSIDFSTGNLQYTTANCGAFTLNNMKNGGSYTLAVQGATVATCSFAAYSGSGTTGPLTVHLPPDHAATTASKHTIYTFIVLGGHVYASWIPGY